MVLLQGDNGRQHRILTEVYFIPRLKSNIISIGQLDELGCKTEVESGIMTVLNPLRKMFARVRRAKNRLYILEVQQVDPVCLQAVHGDDAWLLHTR